MKEIPTPSNPELFHLAVLNPGGGDPHQTFSDRAGMPVASGHPPVNYHAYAACTRGSFHRDAKTIAPDSRAVLLLLRRDLKLCLKSLIALQAAGKVVAVSLKESGSHQVAALLADPAKMALFREICVHADLCLSSTPDLIPLYLGAGARWAEFLPTPYPVDDTRWDFARPVSERRGIFLGTREFDVPSRNHLAALLSVRQLGVPVTVCNLDGRRGRRRLQSLGFEKERLRIVEGKIAYPDYLRLVASHRIVFQLDRSAVPGQVAGDALLAHIPCVGGDGAVDRLAFYPLSCFCQSSVDLIANASLLLRDDAAYAQAVEESQQLAREQLSFTVVAERLASLFTSLSSKPQPRK